MQSVQLCDSQAYQAPEAGPDLPPTDLWPGQTHSQLSGTGCCRQQLISDPENGIGKRQERTGDAADQAGHLDLQGAADGEGRGETGAGLLLYYILKHAYLGVNRFSKD